MGEGVPTLRLVSSYAKKPKRVYAGQPLECKACNNRLMIECVMPTFRDGRINKGTQRFYLCAMCRRTIWP